MKKLLFVVFVLTSSYLNAQLACIANINLSIGESGESNIGPEVTLGPDFDSDYQYLVSPNHFTCEDVGSTVTVVTYQYFFGQLVNSCYSSVHIEDKIDACVGPPIACIANISLSLNADGTALLTPSTVLASPLNPAYTYSVSPSEFDCNDVGIHTGTVTVTTPGGSTNTCTFNVQVVDRRVSPPPCLTYIMTDYRFYPIDFIFSPIPLGTPINFELSFLSNDKDDFKLIASNQQKTAANNNTKALVIIALSDDEILDENDAVMFSQTIHFKKKDENVNVYGSLKFPKGINPGTYNVIIELQAEKKKEEIGFSTWTQPIHFLPNEIAIIGIPQFKPFDKSGFYPNPVQDYINFSLPDGKWKVCTLNHMGQILSTIRLEGGMQSMNLAELKPGAYLIKGMNEQGETFSEKIIKL